MEIITFRDDAYCVLEDMKYPLKDDWCNDDKLCIGLNSFYEDPNSVDLCLIRYTNSSYKVMRYDDVLDEIEYFNSKDSIYWIEPELKDFLLAYFIRVEERMVSYRREEKLNKVLNSNVCTLSLAC